jgi:hypothetical protein
MSDADAVKCGSLSWLAASPALRSAGLPRATLAPSISRESVIAPLERLEDYSLSSCRDSACHWVGYPKPRLKPHPGLRSVGMLSVAS